MSKFLDKVTSALGFSKSYDEDYDDYDDYEEDEIEEAPKPVSRASGSSREYSSRSSSRYEAPSYEPVRREVSRVAYSGSTSVSSGYSRARSSKVVNLNANVQMEVVVSSPETMEEAKEIAQHMKEKKPVVINLEFVDQPIAQRITDFLCGCCHALNGNVQRIADKIFMIAPDNVDFAGDLDIREKLQSEGGLIFPWQED